MTFLLKKLRIITTTSRAHATPVSLAIYESLLNIGTLEI